MDVQSDEQLIGVVARRLQWILVVMMFIAFMDRTNISFVASHMNQDIGLTTRQFGWGASLFFLGYLLFEVPSNLAMARVGARRWLARIMITWGIVSAGSAFASGPVSFYVARFLLGVAEAGFIPGVMLYLSYWSPQRSLGKFTGWFMMVIPISASLTALLTASLLSLDQVLGFAGWRWAFFVEGLPAIIVGVLLLRYLADTPAKATWLTDGQKTRLQAMIAADQVAPPSHNSGMLRQALATHPFHLPKAAGTGLIAVPSQAHAVQPVTVLQTEYSLFERDVESVLPTTRALGISFVAYSRWAAVS